MCDHDPYLDGGKMVLFEDLEEYQTSEDCQKAVQTLLEDLFGHFYGLLSKTTMSSMAACFIRRSAEYSAELGADAPLLVRFRTACARVCDVM